MTELTINGQTPDEEVPAWLREALNVEPSTEFRQKARAAAQVARGLILLRREREKVGLGQCTLADYMKALALLVGTDLAPILDWFGVRNLELIDETIAGGVGRLLRRLGVPRDNVAELLIRSEAARIGAAIPAFAFDDDHAGNRETVVAELKQQFSAADLSRLHSIQELVIKAYDADE